MKVYTRLTPRDWYEAKVKYSTPQAQRIILKKCWNLENVIESGEICDREEVRKETARTCIILAKQYQNGKKIVRDIAEKYDIDLEVEE